MAGLFGFSITDSTPKPKKQISPVAQSNEEGLRYRFDLKTLRHFL